jgi:hypothetical protein
MASFAVAIAIARTTAATAQQQHRHRIMTTAQRTPSFTEAMDPDSPTLVVKGIAVLGTGGLVVLLS